MDSKAKALYLHIPFCDKICAYCDFPKVLTSIGKQKEYLAALLNEVEGNQIPFDSLRTIYIGGGTPSALSEENLILLLSYLHQHFPHVLEFTLEANPESLTEEKIKICQEYGVNRISLGVQSANDKTLKLLNRNHTREDAFQAVMRLRKLGFENFNLDFIYGIPGMTLKDLDEDIDFALYLKPKHLSFYSLQIEEGTLFSVEHVSSENDDDMASQYEHLVKRLRENGYARYEVSNFSLPGYESKHNLTYWHDQHYYACGLGASSYLGNVRKKQTLNFSKYLQNQKNFFEEIISPETEEFEYLMLNLRLESGFNLNDFQARFGKNFLVSYKKEISEVSDYVSINGSHFFLKSSYFFTMDNILLSLLHSPE